MSATAYVTKARLSSIERLLRPRQWDILYDVDRLGIASGKQLRTLHYEQTKAGSRLARHDLADLVAWEALTPIGRRIGGQDAGSEGHVYALGLAGQRLIHPGRTRYRSPWTPQPRQLRHALGVSQLYTDLRTAERRGLITLDRFDAEPACWRRYFGPGGGRLWLKPDAHVVLRTGAYEDHYWVEIDNATEHVPQIAEKARCYIRYFQTGAEEAETGVFPQVLWVTPDERRRVQLTTSLDRLPPDHRLLFAVTTRTEAVDYLTTDTPPLATNQERPTS